MTWQSWTPLNAEQYKPDVEEIRRKMGPILAELCRAVSPAIKSLDNYRGILGVDLAAAYGALAGIASKHLNDENLTPSFDQFESRRNDILKKRMGVHALIYLAGNRYGCPGLDHYDFGSDSAGVFSFMLDLDLDALDSLQGVGEMEWDSNGEFAKLVRERAHDPGWLAAASLICLVEHKMRPPEASVRRNDLLEEVYLECVAFTRAYLSQVYEEILPRMLDAANRPLPDSKT